MDSGPKGTQSIKHESMPTHVRLNARSSKQRTKHADEYKSSKRRQRERLTGSETDRQPDRQTDKERARGRCGIHGPSRAVQCAFASHHTETYM